MLKVVLLWALAAPSLALSFGDRQRTTWWRLRGIIDFARGRGGWGAMQRRGVQRS